MLSKTGIFIDFFVTNIFPYGGKCLVDISWTEMNRYRVLLFFLEEPST